MSENLYAERDIEAQGNFYTRHVSAMTSEDLHRKSDIAAELAHRDIQIEVLWREVKELRAANRDLQHWFDDARATAERAQGDQWLIQLRGEYLATRGIWERSDHCGYTNDIHEAGRYSEAEANKAENMAPEKYKAVRLPAPASGEVCRCIGPGNGCCCDSCDPNPESPATARPPAAKGGVPEGWKLVPITPSGEMCTAAVQAEIKSNTEYGEPAQFSDIWDSMIEAAPQPPQEQYCNYPDCQCPFDRGPEFFCLKSLPQDPAEMK